VMNSLTFKSKRPIKPIRTICCRSVRLGRAHAVAPLEEIPLRQACASTEAARDGTMIDKQLILLER
jgi:hypothetical protein